MALKRVVAYNAANTADAAVKIKDTMVAAGWVLHDDQAAASKYYILTSTGEAADQMKVYAEINWNTANKILMYGYVHWNATAHTGTIKLGSAPYVFISADDDGAFWLWVYCDKNGTAIISKVGTVYRAVYMQAITPFWTVKGKLASGATTGANSVITLGAGEADNFKTGVTYQIVGVGTEGRELVAVNAVDTGANTITVDNLAVDYAANSVVGQVPWPWTLSVHDIHTYVLTRASTGTTAEGSNSVVVTTMLTNTYTDPDAVGDQQYTLWPVIFQDRAYGTLGYSKGNVLVACVGASYEDSIGITKQDSGTATSGTATTLTDTNKAWTINEFADKAIVLTAGAGGGDVRKIVSNTATEITIDVAFSATPDVTSEYAVYDEVWRHFYFGSTTKARAFREV